MKCCIVLFCLAGFAACKRQKPDIDKLANGFAALEYRAVTLREHRFALANQIRFTEDTLLHSKTADKDLLQMRLATMNAEKQVLTTNSLALADTIRQELNYLTASAHLSPQERLDFNDRLNNILAERYSLNVRRTVVE